MTSERKVSFDEMHAVSCIESSERGVDRRGQGAARRFGKTPEKRDCEELAFPGGQPFRCKNLTVAPVERYREFLWVD